MKDTKRGVPLCLTSGAGTSCLDGSYRQGGRRRSGDKMEFLDMHADALAHIASFLDHRDVISLSSTCSLLLTVVDTGDVWMNLCKKWSNCVPLEEWAAKVDSPKALFRVLHSFDAVVGAWSAQELAPRGGLLYVTWGKLSVVAFRIMPEWMAQGLVCMKLFEVVAERDGSSRVALLTGRGGQHDVPLPGAIVWESDCRSEFHLETHTSPESTNMPPSEGQDQAESSPSPLEEVAAAVALQEQQRQSRLREHLYQQQLIRSMWLAEDAPHVHLPGVIPEVPAENNRLRHELAMRFGNIVGNRAGQGAENGGNGFGPGAGHANGNGSEYGHGNQELRHRAVQYLLRLAMGGPNRGSASADGTAQDSSGNFSTEANKPRSLMRSVAVPKSRYMRLRVDVPCKGQELAGLWTGVYGPHGLEILNIDYTEERMIVATKVLGDPNVPCGKVTFRASLDSENSEPPPDSQRLATMSAGQSEEGEWDTPSFVTTYEGEGRVAGYNYRHPSWVSGQLLVEKGGRFAFLWKDVNFFIRFRRLSLSELVQLQQSGSSQ